MTRNKRIDQILYILGDYIAVLTAWALFYFIRKSVMDPTYSWFSMWSEGRFQLGIGVIPIGWMLWFAFMGSYGDVYRFSRFSVLVRSFFLTFTGSLAIYFIVLLDDDFAAQWTHLQSWLTLFGICFLFVSISRMLQLTVTSWRLKTGQVQYATLLIGNRTAANNIYQELTRQEDSQGQAFLGYISTFGGNKSEVVSGLSKLGRVKDIDHVIREKNIEEVIIAIEDDEHHLLDHIINELFQHEQLLVRITPNLEDIILGKVKLNHVYGALLIEIDKQLMPTWQVITKRIMDIVGSTCALVFLSPLLLYAYIRVRHSSKGPGIFAQERIGKHGRPFTMYKFRSMRLDAEKDGPQLAQADDDRTTPWGAIMRKWRIDELPQFWNVLRGDMSLVGPRPERAYFIKKLMQHAPHHRHLLKVKPGITSWGQVKYGYASTLDEMLMRLSYDILYIENMSLALDIKIMLYTIQVVFQGRGR